ncbi:predicted protein [Streptomyces viridosporus ATCC 14672]|uniref:Predicted protein n=1 Tax=Streptomyces viridosporus (strain ATCC 14672 / DSM 40746 / JCM 4963 / KCTC 9882 / NRRL B-12104 / FH 1290) TaxID=566461 RepID=D5ZVQ5_STRV1|nr:predicted protein [Streptomyces viridosporus ATCC 14672]
MVTPPDHAPRTASLITPYDVALEAARAVGGLVLPGERDDVHR